VARKVGLTIEDVTRAAVEIADAQGLAAVTIGSVAARLGIRSPSLYAHVAGLDEVRRLVALHAAGAMASVLREATGERAGLEAVRELAFAYRRFAAGHPGLYAAAQRAVRPGEDDELYRALAAAAMPAIEALAQAGVGAGDLVHLARALRAALHGFVALEQAGGFGMPESVDESFSRLVEVLLAGVRAAVPT
jgi:AcrR family transcriptional regulator